MHQCAIERKQEDDNERNIQAEAEKKHKAEDDRANSQTTAMRGTGAHRLLQVRTRVLKQELRHDFERWHPARRATAEPVRLAA